MAGFSMSITRPADIWAIRASGCCGKISSIFSATSSRKELEDLWRGIQPGAGVAMRDSHRRRDGTVFPVEIHISCLQMDGHKFFFHGARHQLAPGSGARRTKAERGTGAVRRRALQWRKSADLLQAVMDGATNAIFVKDLEGHFLCSTAPPRTLRAWQPKRFWARLPPTCSATQPAASSGSMNWK
jgi:hypothetical protein